MRDQYFYSRKYNRWVHIVKFQHFSQGRLSVKNGQNLQTLPVCRRMSDCAWVRGGWLSSKPEQVWKRSSGMVRQHQHPLILSTKNDYTFRRCWKNVAMSYGIQYLQRRWDFIFLCVHSSFEHFQAAAGLKFWLACHLIMGFLTNSSRAWRARNLD